MIFYRELNQYYCKLTELFIYLPIYLLCFGSIWQHLAAFGYPMEQSTSEGFFEEQ